VEKPKLVLCFTAYRKIISANKRRLYDDTLYQKSLYWIRFVGVI